MKKWSVVSVFAAALLAVSSVAYAGPLADATADSLWGIEIGGYFDISYTYNINEAGGAGQGVNGARVFDTDHD